MISVFEIFKIGIGPSSSHTMGPMVAALRFLKELKKNNLFEKTTHLKAHVYGSLCLTGIGHGTDKAILAGLSGQNPETIDIAHMPEHIQHIKETGIITPFGDHPVQFKYDQDFVFHKEALPLHENGMCFEAFDSQENLLLQKYYYSIGGGFVVEESEFSETARDDDTKVPYPYKNAEEILAHCQEQNLRLSTVTLKNEMALHSEQEISDYCQKIWKVMKECIDRGLNTEGILPGPLRVSRRAPMLKERLANTHSKDPMYIIDWLNMVAMAVNEENAAGGRVVTAPTNGACGIVPAVLAYYDRFVRQLTPDLVMRYLLVCSNIASLYKMNASISGAEVGCQGEIGVAASMAAAGLTDLEGGTATQVCEAAEIAMEHHLGLTCDPVGGQVQVPCIERNGISAVKAVNASRMALMRQTKPVVTLDEVIATMYETGKDMNQKYRETSIGGLAVHVIC